MGKLRAMVMRYAPLLALVPALLACGGAENNGADTAHCAGPRTASYSNPDGGERLEVLCSGPAGCVESDAGRVDCDTSAVAPNDPCTSASSGVAECWSNTIILVCDGTRYVPEGCRDCIDDGVMVRCVDPNGCTQGVDGGWTCSP